MNVAWWNRDTEWRGVMRRAIAEFCQRSPELFDRTEHCLFVPDVNGLGVWIGIDSIRTMDRFDVIHRSVFQGFAPEGRHTDGEGMEWRHFGYSRPSAHPEKVGGVIRFVAAA